MSMTPERLQEIIDTSEFDSWLGLSVLELQENRLEVRMPFREEIVGTPKVNRLHGGALASLIDATGCYLLIAALNKRVSTVNMLIDYMRPCHGEMVAVAQIAKRGRQICNVNVTVTDKDGKEVAAGRLCVMPSSVTVGAEEHAARIA